MYPKFILNLSKGVYPPEKPMYYGLSTFYLCILFKSSKSLPSITPPFLYILQNTGLLRETASLFVNIQFES